MATRLSPSFCNITINLFRLHLKNQSSPLFANLLKFYKKFNPAMSQKSRLPLYAGAAAVGAVGYYLYSAGGSPKVAEKKFERKLIGLESIDRLEL